MNIEELVAAISEKKSACRQLDKLIINIETEKVVKIAGAGGYYSHSYHDDGMVDAQLQLLRLHRHELQRDLDSLLKKQETLNLLLSGEGL
ncbi:coil containing protein [Vibrio phage 1.139.A._10N.261.48.C6]|nr:coil containing protein [Vibrio phage 1.034.O._10N.261.46.B7]AUR83466.1 coil containing protein [Vibrio phage 1.034.X._10N.261.46.B7]AUR90204.1 coil containing protein [Vibrio phage 1.139.A._10N.261.48.C6]AUR90271.1 coil containing protein [Vibrio phage 1.139.B._10N.261.48.C6]AUR95592.1 coil containing protein [Vibrio phage 1.209.O._10N.222.52.B2]